MSPEIGNGPGMTVEIAGIRFPNPLLLASGIADETGASMAMAVRKGAGGVVTKSLSIGPRDGHPNPCIIELPFGMINAMGLPNPGIDDYRGEVDLYLRKTGKQYPIIASIFGSTIEEYGEAASMCSDMGVNALEINGSCPNAKGLGLQFGQDEKVIRKLVEEVVSRTSLPVFFKLTPNTDNINSLGLAAQDGGARGLVAINTLQAMMIDIYTRRPLLTNVTGGLSGPAIRPVGVRCIYSLASDTDIEIPLIAVGGVSRWQDAIEYMMAGASAVQIGTAVTWGDLDTFRNIREGMVRFLVDEGIEDINDIIGSSTGVKQ